MAERAGSSLETRWSHECHLKRGLSDALEYWTKEVKEVVSDVVIGIVANKIDFEIYEVESSEVSEWAEKNDFFYIEARALTGKGECSVMQFSSESKFSGYH
jgi:hypothetical protein